MRVTTPGLGKDIEISAISEDFDIILHVELPLDDILARMNEHSEDPERDIIMRGVSL